MRRAVGTYEIDDDPARVDPAAAVAFLTTEAYWGRWRGEPDIRRQIAAAWRVTGAYDQAGAMVGFARAFGDGGSAYLADVYVLPAHRGAGPGPGHRRDDGRGRTGRGLALDAAHRRRARPVPPVRLRLAVGALPGAPRGGTGLRPAPVASGYRDGRRHRPAERGRTCGSSRSACTTCRDC